MSEDGKDVESTEAVSQECTTNIPYCKQEKRNAKSQMTRLLNKLVIVLTEDDSLVDIIKGPLGCLVSVKKRLKYTLLNSYYKSKCFARPQKACMLFTLAIFTGSSLKTFTPLKK